VPCPRCGSAATTSTYHPTKVAAVIVDCQDCVYCGVETIRPAGDRSRR
jgi:hypothetical protein